MGYDCCDFCMGPVHGDEHRTCVNRCSKWLRKHAKRLIRELETDLARVTAERDKLQAGVSCGCSDCRLRLENLTLRAENARLREALEAFAAERSWHAIYIGTWDRPEWQWRWARPERPRDFARAALAGEVPNAD